MKAIRLGAVMLFAVAVPVMKAQVGLGPMTRAENRPQGVSAPVPTLLTQAKTVFLSNGGADAGLFPHPFSGSQDRGYGYLYKAMAAGGHFQMVASPGEAEVVMELQLSSPLGPLGTNKQAGTGDPLPTFKLILYDRPTHYVLWTITQTVDPAALQKTHDKNFDMALDSILGQLMELTK